MKTTVVNKYNETYDVYIGRGSKWGNPFRIGRDGTRAEVIEKYDAWLKGQISAPGNPERPSLADARVELTGQRLGCFCKPLACHGDILIKYIDLEHSNETI